MGKLEDWLIIKNKMDLLKKMPNKEERKEILDDLSGKLRSYKTNYHDKFDYHEKPEKNK